jgi:hypothetical protein
MKKLDAVRSENGTSLNGAMKSINWKPRFGGGKRDFKNMLPTTRSPRIRNAVARMAHPKPIVGISRETMMGRMTPPMLEPETMMPKARARRRANHVPAAARAAEIRTSSCAMSMCADSTYSGRTGNYTPWRYTRSAQGRTGSICARLMSSSGQRRGERNPEEWET